MQNSYNGVNTRFLRQDERLMLSEENEMPLVIEPIASNDVVFLQKFLASHSTKILEDIATYGAVLLRGFEIASEEDFENAVLSIQGFQGVSDAFMSEEGRTHVGQLKYVLHTNAVYKTGGTVYLGGFHSENYYSADVPSYICFCCLKPSDVGGETGLINMEKIYHHLDETLKQTLEKNSFFVSKWLVSEVAERYQISVEQVLKFCRHFDLPVVGEGAEKFVLMYKPSVFEHPITKKKSLQINLFEILPLNVEMRKCFMQDYAGKTWFWHRFVWKLPAFVLSVLEFFYIMFASFFHSPKEAMSILKTKWNAHRATCKQSKSLDFNDARVGRCFSEKDVKELAKLIRTYYSSCLWKKGDILLVDNRKVMHAGMPGAGDRVIRVLIGNSLEMGYSAKTSGVIDCTNRTTNTIGSHFTAGSDIELTTS